MTTLRSPETAATSTALPPASSPHAARRTLTAAVFGIFLTILDASAVNVGLSAMGRDLGGGMSALQWVVDAYTLLFAALMLSAGAMSDRIGAHRAFGWGLALFTLASVACGLAPGLGVLIGARVVQGAAAALMMPASLALVRQAYGDPSARARAIGIWTAGGAVAIAAGPIAGGLLTSAWSWRGIFFVNVPFGIIALLLLARTSASPRRHAPLDLPGQLTAVIALASLTFTVIEGGQAGYTSPEVLSAIALTLIAGTAFVVAESRQAEPMVPLGLFRNRTVSAALTAGFAINAGYYGIVFVLSLYLQQVRGDSPLVAGLMFVPMTGFISIVNLYAARISGRFGTRLPIVTGLLIVTAGMLALLTVEPNTPATILMLLIVPVGLGGAVAVPTLTAVLLESVPAERAGMAGGLFNAVRQIGGGLAVALFGSLVASGTTFHTGMTTSLLIGTALLLTAAATTLSLLPRR